ncbi:iron-containing alcohol dehydrogenase [Sphingomonas sp.]|uniref:iron-containing alcohol dehydrogenase n=1 Tax=Sphingomonas sp. TaxID=28214 RepID=UPI0025DB9EA3|nr:iron-containing alcohol dehydrogenase [Sphingomonas sp.]
MAMVFVLPKLVFGSGCLASLSVELGAARALLISDRGIERAGLVAKVAAAANFSATFLDVPENPTIAGADAALAAFRNDKCNVIVALGGGSVLDTAKLVAAAAGTGCASTGELLGRPDAVRAVAMLIAIPTTVGTGSESSPVAALHRDPQAPAIGTRSLMLVPHVALCDPDLVSTLPPRLIAATAVDALSHCIEGYFANPTHPLIDALALDGIARVVANAAAAMIPDGPEGPEARASLMAAAFAGGAAIHKGLGPAHAIALVCGDQDIHHGTLVAIALPSTTALLARHVPAKGARVRAAMGLAADANLGDFLREFIHSLGLPDTLAAAGYRFDDSDALVRDMVASHFNRTSPYAPSHADYAALLKGMRR